MAALSLQNFSAYMRLQNYKVICYNGRVMELTKEQAERAKKIVIEVGSRRPAHAIKFEALFRRMRVFFDIEPDADEVIAINDMLYTGKPPYMAGPNYMLCVKCMSKDYPQGEEPDKKLCGRCRAQHYCCRDAQVMDWNMRHKKECIPK